MVFLKLFRVYHLKTANYLDCELCVFECSHSCVTSLILLGPEDRNITLNRYVGNY